MKHTIWSFLSVVFISITGSAFAQTWTGGTGNWNTPANWAGATLPLETSGEARILNGTVSVNSAAVSYNSWIGGTGHGQVGVGTVTVSDGGAFSTSYTYIGANGGPPRGSGTINVQGTGTWTIQNQGQTYVGISNGNGEVNITDGGTVTSYGRTYIGYGAIGTMRISGPNSSWTFAGDYGAFGIGYLANGSGTLTLENGGKMKSTRPNSVLVIGDTGSGTLNIGSGGAAGYLETSRLSGTGKLNFNHNETNYAFQPNIQGSIRVEQQGTGTTSITLGNSYTGGTTVTGGRLAANNTFGSAFGTGAVIVNANTTLSGIGSFSGAATIHGTYAPGNSVGRLTSGAITVATGGNYEWEINKADGAAGTTSGGWDFAQINGQLTFQPGTTLSIVSLGLDNLSGLATGFDGSLNYLWNIATATGGITGIENVTIDSADFENPHSGVFSLTNSGNTLQLSYSPVPEPSALLLAGAAAIGAFTRRRRIVLPEKRFI